MSNHRDRSLLDLAHLLHVCCNCGKYSPEGLEPAHQNGISAGKGQSIKGDDFRHAALCHDCHLWYDSGSAPRDEKAIMWFQAHLETYARYWENGWIKVVTRFRN